MSRFRYGLDPLCLVAMVTYAFGRWGLRSWIGSGFWHDQFTDLLLVPAALPLVLWLQRRVGLRLHDAPPTWREVGLHLAVWSLAAEIVAPPLFSGSTGDWRDLVAYGAGATLAGAWWRGV